jgi:glucokinase
MSVVISEPVIDWGRLTRPVACVDIGGTKVAVSVADAHGVRGKVAEPTAKEGNHGALAAQIIRMVGQSCSLAGVALADVSAVGVSTCGPFVLNDGLVELAGPNICGGLAGRARGLPNDWTTALLEAPLRAAFPHVRVENDGVGALEAERRWGALQRQSHCAYVTWSTGVGVGLCVDGHVLRGKNGNAGHGGHSFVSSGDDALCGCGNRGDVEGLVAGNAIARRFAGQGFSDAAAIFVAAYAGNTRATAIIDDLCENMGRMLYNLIVTLDLQRISLGGSVFWNNQALLLPKLQAVVAGKLPALTTGVEIVPAGLGDKVGDYAALALVMG